MSICTKTGDKGTTGLMYNRRVLKTHPRLEAYGTVDELNAALGVARAGCAEVFVTAKLFHIQKNLVDLMGELATDKADLERYAKDGYTIFGAEFSSPLENWIAEIEAQKISFKHWATPGALPDSAALDMARTIARRAERRVEGLLELGETDNRCIQVYLNRVSDLLWLLARWVETQDESPQGNPQS
ncbi:MAG: cob(I)yrinic acid a,c-diamide adenosyltransferase [Limisphaerales bacterium]